MPGSTQPPEPSLHPSHAQLDASPARRKAVHFSASPAGKASPTRASKAALDGGAGGARCSPQKASLLVRQGSWTIEAQRTDRMEALNSSSPPPAASEASPLPSLLLSGGAGSVGAMTSSPASVGYLESARKAEELRGRLERLEAALREMESKAVAHLDKSLQDKVLTTAGGCCRVSAEVLAERAGEERVRAGEERGGHIAAWHDVAAASPTAAARCQLLQPPAAAACAWQPPPLVPAKHSLAQHKSRVPPASPPLQPRSCRSASWPIRNSTRSCSTRSCR